ncbi:hypothetical protein QSV08_13920 [Maribacter sp. BPC-D8]|uniref:hypothetical protein n=1 Tax=Maribacter sp. BPC-D8 TaxID=3053613 RepID=UPI002B47F4B4|nr:hypothetical protein [Maribacter sp. BPC-D8]WRI28317.1 hypothetical protein QSV08_13920 [Maribacter sp. BPC-D8]
MKIIFLTHHKEFRGYSIHRYTNFLSHGFKSKGHTVDVWAPKSILGKSNLPKQIKKWFRYVDTFILFPIYLKKKINSQPKSTLYVVTDQALGMWMPFLKKKII